MAAYAAAVHASGGAMPALPLVRKKWWPRRAITEVTSRMVVEHAVDGATCYADRPSRHHRCDGVVLVPVNAYRSGTDFQLLKFKEAAAMTLDFRIEADESAHAGVRVGFDGAEHTWIDFTEQVVVTPFERARIYGDLGGAGRRSAIAEFAFDAECGRWRYLFLRADKAKPNFHKTVFDTIAAIAEHVTLAELEFRLLSHGPSEASRWQREQTKMHEALLEWKRAEVKRAAAQQQQQQQQPP